MQDYYLYQLSTLNSEYVVEYCYCSTSCRYVPSTLSINMDACFCHDTDILIHVYCQVCCNPRHFLKSISVYTCMQCYCGYVSYDSRSAMDSHFFFPTSITIILLHLFITFCSIGIQRLVLIRCTFSFCTGIVITFSNIYSRVPK